jgi:hypothetical protein
VEGGFVAVEVHVVVGKIVHCCRLCRVVNINTLIYTTQVDPLLNIQGSPTTSSGWDVGVERIRAAMLQRCLSSFGGCPR